MIQLGNTGSENSLENNILRLIDKFKIISREDLFNILSINKREVRFIMSKRLRSTLKNAIIHDRDTNDKEGIYDKRILFNERLNTFVSYNKEILFITDNDYFVSIENLQKFSVQRNQIIKNETDYKEFVSFFCFISNVLNITEINDINFESERVLFFKYMDGLIEKKAKLVNYTVSMKEEDILRNTDDVNNIVIFLNERLLNTYIDITVPLKKTASIFTKSEGYYYQGRSIKELKEKVE